MQIHRLIYQDFRSAVPSNFLTQVVGRAGQLTRKVEVIIQTYNLIQPFGLQQQDYDKPSMPPGDGDSTSLALSGLIFLCTVGITLSQG